MEIDKFLERFNFFYDSIIRDVKISFRNSSFSTNIKIIISAKDNESSQNNGWVNVNIEIDKVTEFNFRESAKESYQVLSSGLHILELTGLFYFDFGFYVDAPQKSEEFKESNFYIVGQNLSWKVELYQEFLK